MATRDLRTWMAQLEAAGELKRVTAKVDWDDELPQIVRKVGGQGGPALLFENIKDHENTFSRRVFANGLGSRARFNLMLGLATETSVADALDVIRSRLKKPIEPIRADSGPVKENILTGTAIDLFQIPVPQMHPLDGGRYINTFCTVVTRDPDTGRLNVGVYRGMILSKNQIVSLLTPRQDWGTVFDKYKALGKPMPVAFVYGYDPCLIAAAGSPLVGPEYDLAGGLRQAPIELVRCETSDLEVPAYAEIVVEGTMSTDPANFASEGPFGEGSGLYSEASLRPVMQVTCITHRHDAVFRCALAGTGPGVANEVGFAIGPMMLAAAWNVMDAQDIPGILDIAMTGPVLAIKIHKTYQGQPRQIAAALWGSKLAGGLSKLIMVVEEEVDIRNPLALWGAMSKRVDYARDLVVYPINMGWGIDLSIPFELRDDMKYGAALRSALLIDATIDWELHPQRPELGNQRFPPNCHNARPETVELVEKRWQEYQL